ncbi:MAG: hypothetical protein JNJ88_13120 [Planctomycetes bacterium]|nr:hypothetical protein [Planctomycetota bacterium]
MRRTLLTTTALAVLALGGSSLLPGCGDAEVTRAVSALARAAAVSGPRQAHRGERTIESRIDGALVRHKERVFDDGAGDLGIESADESGRPLEGVQALEFLRAARFQHKYRDLSIDSVDRVLANYKTSIIPENLQISGRSTIHLRFEPRHAGALAIDVWSDRTSGLPLRVERHDGAGAVVASMEYTSVEVGPVRRVAGDPPTLPSAGSSTPVAVASFASPLSHGSAWTPEGFALAESKWLTLRIDGQDEHIWLDRYSDGLEHLIVLQADATSGHWEMPSAGSGATTLSVVRVGTVSVVMTEREGIALTALGRASRESLGGLLVGYELR